MKQNRFECSRWSPGASLTAWLIISVSTACLAQDTPPKRIQVQGAFLAVRDKTELPALERGNLIRLTVTPGSRVTSGQELASLDDREATLSLEVAQLDVQIAEKKITDSRSIEIAEASHTEAERLLDQAREEANISEQTAADDTSILLAQKEEELARDRLERAAKSREFSKISVSEQEWLALQNEFDKKQISTRKARIDQTLAQMRSRSKAALLSHQQTSVERLELEVQESKSAGELEKLGLLGLQKAVAIAEARLERRRLRAPFDGLVVEQMKNVGEWAEAGESVLRIIGLDRLYVEGFVDSSTAHGIQTGQAITVTADVNQKRQEIRGTLVFLSPEVDSNGQVLVRGEILNPGQSLGPGERVEMWIESGQQVRDLPVSRR